MRLAVILLYFACSCQTVLFVKGGAGVGRAPASVIGELGQNVTLPCHDLAANVTPALTQWFKDGTILVQRNHSSELKPVPGHLSILDNGSLVIVGLLTIDEGVFKCQCSSKDISKVHNHTGVILQIASRPDDVTLEISPAQKLPNGTLYVPNGTTVHFKCTTPSVSHPSQTLSWILERANSSRSTLVSGNGTLIQFEELSILPSYQGEHICLVENNLSHEKIGKTLQLLVYYPPERHPQCSWREQNVSSIITLVCSWQGGYPAPSLQWDDLASLEAVLNSTEDTVEVTLNRTLLRDGQELRCTGKHVATSDGEEKFCHFTLKTPYPEGEPLVTVVEGSNVTLTCTEKQSVPPAKTIWQRTVAHLNVKPSAKYIISDLGPTFSLTIVNITKEDEGTYFCRSENPVAVRELEIYLTVKSSVSYTGGIVGMFLSILILGVGICIGMAVYSNRHRICLGYRFGFMTEERNDVLNLVDSDDEEIFQDAVPRLPALPNGHSTTLVEIHRIPSSDHEDQENTQGSQENTQQSQENQDAIIVAE
ncbi:V-set and immunoglobulin domain-containing protein 10 [Sardina pilchardus]|uniref:V-set and immunoglobulin domain-containing protein 10 n=1 Tax=Sardina pilchardus TaxID=27697 RepID=UPI002E0F5027